ncbi:hypothetical protein AZA_89935 [Nitrospirillum viridazoti Y2]|nr:hypothetical protein AZA_89935 [Nitrospirillum amazonense Y2]
MMPICSGVSANERACSQRASRASGEERSVGTVWTWDMEAQVGERVTRATVP